MASQDDDKSISYDIRILSDNEFETRPFQFDPALWDSIDLPIEMRNKLCLRTPDKHYTLVGTAFSFPDADDNPVVNSPSQPALLWWDPHSPVDKLLVQLGPHFPPALWLPVKPAYDSLKRVFSEFLDVDSHTMQRHLLYFEKLQSQMEAKAGRPLTEISPERMRELIVDDRRQIDPATVQLDWPNQHRIYLGTAEHYVRAEESFLNNPFLFAWPIVLGHENHFQTESRAKVAIFRTVYSKSLIFLEGREDLELEHTDPADHSVLQVPLFATINFADNSRMCGGGSVVRKFNELFRTDFPLNTPVDIVATCLNTASVGVPQLREQFRMCVTTGSAEATKVVRVLVSYLAVLRDPDWKKGVFDVVCKSTDAGVRWACAKGALELGLKPELRQLVESETDPQVKSGMQRLLHFWDEQDKAHTS